jgi:hypothetical protein
MSTASKLLAVAVACLSSACFHQIVQTGRTPGATVIEKPWTATWLWGLVPANEISSAAQCPNGVATVETQQSFLNGLVGGLTLGIYTPQDVKIICASGSAMAPAPHEIDVAHDAPLADRIAAIQEAIAVSARTHDVVVVRY